MDIEVGTKHGYLTVIKELGRNRGHLLYECQCDCGRKAVLRSSHFYPTRLYCSRSCSILPTKKGLAGRKIGRWTVLKFSGHQLIGGKRRGIWECVCECGTARSLNGEMLASGVSQSCGCSLASTRTREEHLEARREAARKYVRNNPARIKAHKINYEAKIAKATPPWLTQEHWAQMNALYLKARRLTEQTGIVHQVDHIDPINGEFVSGLHVPWNLQILTRSANVAKSNRYAELSGD